MGKFVIVTIVVSSLLYSCCKGIVTSKTVYRNITNRQLVLSAFINGSVTKIATINGSSFLQFQEGESILGGSIDSVTVTWEPMAQAVHYLPEKVGNNVKAISFDNKRNLFNSVSYDNKVTELKCDGTLTEKIYTFTQQDYLDAKK